MQKFFSILTAAILFFSLNITYAAQLNNKNYIEVESVYYLQEGQSLNKARRAAEILAYRQMAEEIGEIRVTSDSTLKDLEELHDDIRVNVSKAVSGAKIVSSDKDADGNFHVVLRLNIFGGTNSLANAIIPQDVEPEDFPPPKFITLDSKYTGLIVDCSGQELSAAVMPKIQSAGGQEIYAAQYLNRQTIVNRGMVGYTDNANEGLQRAGNNPLTVKAVKLEKFNSNPVVSLDDSNKILIANQSDQFLDNCAVVFVR